MDFTVCKGLQERNLPPRRRGFGFLGSQGLEGWGGFRVLGPRGNRTVESPSLYPNGRLIAGKDQFSAR